MGYGNLGDGSASKDKKRKGFGIFGRKEATQGAPTTPLNRHSVNASAAPSKSERVVAPAWTPVAVPAVTELDRNGFVKYNLADKDDVFIRAEGADHLFDDSEPVLRKAVPDRFATTSEVKKEASFKFAPRQQKTEDFVYKDPTDMFGHAMKAEKLDESECGTIFLKVQSDDEFDKEIMDDLGVESDGFGLKASRISLGYGEAAVTEAVAVEPTKEYKVPCDEPVVEEAEIPGSSSAFAAESEDMFTEVSAEEDDVGFDISPGELEIEAELDAEEALESNSGVADMSFDVGMTDEPIEIAEDADPEVEPEFVEGPVADVEVEQHEDAADAMDIEEMSVEVPAGQSDAPFDDEPAMESVMEIPVAFDDEPAMESVMEIPVAFDDEPAMESVMEIPVVFDDEPADAAVPEVAVSAVEPNFIDISALEEPAEYVPVEPNFIDISALEEPAEYVPVEPNFIDISALEEPAEVSISVPAESAVVHGTMEIAEETGFIETRFTEMPMAMTDAEAMPKVTVAIPALEVSDVDDDEYDDFLPPTRSPEKREPGVRFRSELMAASVTNLIKAENAEAPVFDIAEAVSEETKVQAPYVAEAEVQDMIAPSSMPEESPAHGSTVSFTFSRGQVPNRSNTGIRFLMGRL
jgi:hypothetical protein